MAPKDEFEEDLSQSRRESQKNEKAKSLRTQREREIANISVLLHGVVQAMPHISVPRRSRSSSFSKSSLSSPHLLDKQKGILVEDDVAGPSCSNQQG